MALSDLKAANRNDDGIATVISILKQKFGERLNTGSSLRDQHAHTTTYIPTQSPDAVIFPENADEVQEIVKICAAYRCPMIPFGTGTSLEGHVNAPSGGLSIDLARMNRIISVNVDDLDCTVEPMVTREDLNVHLRDTGLFFPIDPGANASIGGMTATRASGTNAVRYGTMRENVLSVEAVMPDGRAIRTATRARKSAAGYDLTRLMVGSEGTLGVITSITLKLYGMPESILSGVCPFPTVEAACETVIMTIQSGIPVARIELVDALQMRASREYAKIDLPETPALFLEFHGTEAGAKDQAELFGELAEACGGGPFQSASRPEERNRLWKARHDAYWAALQLRPGAKVVATDVCVPLSNLSRCVVETQADIESMGLIAPIVGHAGDGNFHVQVLIDTDDREEISKAETFVVRLNERALAMDGTCTGEHGIGQGKQGFLRAELGDAVDIMATIKQAIDPDNIMNPGKIFPFGA